jgi:uncharacterized protein (UPF0276 family)
MTVLQALSRTDALSPGIGLRSPHVAEVLADRPAAGWFEVHAENYMKDGPALADLMLIRRDYAVSLHAVGLSLGSADGLDLGHLLRLKDLIGRLEPCLVSDHLSCSQIGGAYLNDLLPLPYTEESLDLFCGHVDRVQETLKRALLIENPSSYLQYRHSSMSETEFLVELVRRTGCKLLCDVNNVYVSAHNLGFDAGAYLAALPRLAVAEIHLAGHTRAETDDGVVLIDSHNDLVSDAVWDLYAAASAMFPRAPSLVEWDSDLPELSVLLAEAKRANDVSLGAAFGDLHVPLRNTQAAFRAALLDENNEGILDVLDGGKGEASARLRIYRNNMFTSLTEVLKTTFPAIYRLVDERFFAYAAHEFIRAHPPAAPCLAEYGDNFPDFLSSFPPCQGHPYFPDVARLEWLLHLSAHAEPAAPLKRSALSKVPHDDCPHLTFNIDPSAYYLWSRFPLDRIWRAAQPGAGEAVDLDSGPAYLEVRSKDGKTAFRSLEPAPYRFRVALAMGATLEAASDAAHALDPFFDLALALCAALGEGLFTGFRVAAQSKESLP